MKINELAEKALKYIDHKNRDGVKIVTQKDDAPEWFNDLCRTAHGDLLPDDYRYEFIEECLQALSESDSSDAAYETIEADIRTSELLHWLASHNSRYCYVDQAVEEFGHSESVITDIQRGQWQEKVEVFNEIVNFLDSKVDDISEQ